MKMIVLGTGIGSNGGVGKNFYSLLHFLHCNLNISFYVGLQNDGSLEILKRDFPSLIGIKITSSNRVNFLARFLYHIGIKEPFLWSISRKTTMIGSDGVNYSKYVFDLAISYSSIPSFIFCFCGLHVHAKNKIAWQHSDLSKNNMAHLPNKSAMKQRMLFLYWKYLNNYNNIVCVSKKSKRDLLDCFPFISNKVLVINNIFEYDNAKSPDNKSSNKLNILSVGRIDYEKGIDISINAARYLKQLVKDFKWIFVGSIKDTDKSVFDYINKYDLNHNIYFSGETNNVKRYYEWATVFVSTSRIEGYPTVFNEAKSYGLPIITTNVAGSDEIIEDSKGGLIVDNEPSNVAMNIFELYHNRNRYNEISFNNKNFPFKNDNERIKKQLTELLYKYLVN